MGLKDPENKSERSGRSMTFSVITLTAVVAAGAAVLELLKPPPRTSEFEQDLKIEGEDSPEHRNPVLIGSGRNFEVEKEDKPIEPELSNAEELSRAMAEMLTPIEKSIETAVKNSRPGLASMRNQIGEARRYLVKFDKLWRLLGDSIESNLDLEQREKSKEIGDWHDAIESAYTATTRAFGFERDWGYLQLLDLAAFEDNWLKFAEADSEGKLPDRLYQEFHKINMPYRRAWSIQTRLETELAGLGFAVMAYKEGVPFRNPFRTSPPWNSAVKEAFDRVSRALEAELEDK